MTICTECKHYINSPRMMCPPVCRASRKGYIGDGPNDFFLCASINKDGACPKYESNVISKASPESIILAILAGAAVLWSIIVHFLPR